MATESLSFKILKQKRGSCRHRAVACAYVLHLLGYQSVNIEKNEIHRWNSIGFKDKDSNVYHAVLDLGGADVKIKSVNFHQKMIDEEREWELKLARFDKNSSLLGPKIVLSDEQLLEKSEKLDLHPSKSSNVTAEEYWETSLMKEGPQLIWGDSISSQNIYASLLNYINKNESPYNGHTLYIDSPEDLMEQLFDVRIANGSAQNVPGRLQYFLLKEDQKAILFINWDHFTPSESATFKSMMDDNNPKIGSFEVHKGIKIIGFTSYSIPKTDAFLSRIPQENHADASIFGTQNFLTQPIKLINNEKLPKEDLLKIDLFQSEDEWKSELLWDFDLKGTDYIHLERLLSIALKEKKSLHIVNPPHEDKNFELFCFRLLNEKKITCNGEWLSLPSDFKIYFSYDLKYPLDSFKIIPYHELKEVKGKIFPLNSTTYSSFHKFFKYKDSTLSKIDGGYLKEYGTNDLLLVTTQLTEPEWSKLLVKMQKISSESGNLFTLSFAPGVLIPEKIKESFKISEVQPILSPFNLKELEEESKLIASSDPDYTVLLLQESKNIPSENLFYLTSETSSSELIEDIKVVKDKNQNPYFSTQKFPLYDKLKKGEKVILCGPIAASLLDELASLFTPFSGLWINGEFEAIKGELYIISPMEHGLQFPFQHKISLEEYQLKLMQEGEVEKEEILNIINFFKIFNRVEFLARKGPKKPLITYQRIRKCIDALQKARKEEQPSENPIKSIILSDYYGEVYAALNIYAKSSFSQCELFSVRIQKLEKLINKINSLQDAEGLYWELLNCFTAPVIRKVLSKKEPERLKALLDIISDTLPESNKNFIKLKYGKSEFNLKIEKKTSQGKSVNKQKSRFIKAIEDLDTKIIFLKGPPGVGKSHTLFELKKCKDVQLFQKIEEWLEPKEKSDKELYILFIDEANMQPNDTYNMFKSLSQKEPKLFYKGKWFALTERHKIILTGNPEDFPGRSYLDMRDYAATIRFKPFNRKSIEEQIVPSLLKGLSINEDMKNAIDQMVTAYMSIQEQKPYYVFSVRDIEMLIWRYCELHTVREISSKKAVQMAIAETFRFCFASEEELLNWMGVKPEDIELPNLSIKSSDYIWTSSRKKILKSLFLNMAIYAKNSQGGKRGILLEGPSGTGKSSLAVKCLEMQGYQDASKKKHENQEGKWYHQITSGSLTEEELKKILINACSRKEAIIIDEYNVKSAEYILNQLLSGFDPEGNPVEGVFVFFTQNPSATYEGHGDLSKAEQNRFDKFIVSSYTKEEKEEILKEKKAEEFSWSPKFQWQNDRTFFYELAKYLEKMRTETKKRPFEEYRREYRFRRICEKKEKIIV